MNRNPKVKPQAGDMTIGTMTFQSNPLPCHQWSAAGCDQMMTAQLFLEAANAAPQRPPMSAWLELDGSPNHHVTMFQIMPPSRAQIRISELTMLVSTRPAATVLATAVPESAPMRLV